jgi:hypothetical protein
MRAADHFARFTEYPGAVRQSNALPLLFAIFTVAGCHERWAAGQGAAPAKRNAAGAISLASAVASARVSPAAAVSPGGDSSAAVVSVPKKGSAGAPSAAEVPRPPAVSCYDGFSPSGSPRVDVVRLGVSCGPVAGLTELAKTSGVVDERGRGPTLRWDAERGDCFRVFAVAAEPVEDIQVDVHGKSSVTEAHVDVNRRWAVVGEDGPFCAGRAGHFEASFTTHAGTGELVASVWRGARMIPRGEGTRPLGGPSEPSPAR